MTIYEPPQTPETEDTICMKIRIPDKQEYRVAFWTALYHFGKWVAWTQDGTDRATRAAQVWKPLIEEARIAYENGEGCEGGDMDLRQNPANPCQLQYDTGSGWVTFADLSACGGEGPTSDPPFPTGMTDQQRIDYIGNIVEFMYLINYWGSATNRTPDVFVQQMQTRVPNIANILGEALFGMATPATNLMAGTPSSEYSPYWVRTNTFWQDLAESVACAPTDDGYWLNEATEALFDFLNTSTDYIFQMLHTVTSYMTPSMMQSIGSGGAGFGGYGNTYLPGGITCGYCKTYDFTIDDYGFTVDDVEPGYTPIEIGEYTSGVGFTRIYHTAPTPERSTVGATKEMGDTIHATKITVTADTPTADYTDFTVAIRPSHYDPGDYMQKLNVVPGGVSDYVFEGLYEFDTLCVDTGAWGDVAVKILAVKIEGNYGLVPPDGVAC